MFFSSLKWEFQASSFKGRDILLNMNKNQHRTVKNLQNNLTYNVDV